MRRWAVRATVIMGLAGGFSLGSAGAQAASPLHDAVIAGDATMVQLLLQAGANPRFRDLEGMTALHYAAGLGKTDLVAALIEAGANVNALTVQGVSALHLAVAGGHTDSLRALLAAGARVDTAVVDGRALRAARQRVEDYVYVRVDPTYRGGVVPPVTPETPETPAADDAAAADATDGATATETPAAAAQ